MISISMFIISKILSCLDLINALQFSIIEIIIIDFCCPNNQAELFAALISECSCTHNLWHEQIQRECSITVRHLQTCNTTFAHAQTYVRTQSNVCNTEQNYCFWEKIYVSIWTWFSLKLKLQTLNIFLSYSNAIR